MTPEIIGAVLWLLLCVASTAVYATRNEQYRALPFSLKAIFFYMPLIALWRAVVYVMEIFD